MSYTVTYNNYTQMKLPRFASHSSHDSFSSFVDLLSAKRRKIGVGKYHKIRNVNPFELFSAFRMMAKLFEAA